MIQGGDRGLLLDRQHDHFKGCTLPGDEVEFPESMMESAKREVKEGEVTISRT